MDSKPNYDPSRFDWQGHRGARGLLPENTIPAFIKALEFKVKTLELDVVVSKDQQIIVSHEPWFSHEICTKPDGIPVTEEEAQSLNLYTMTYEEIKQYDCGLRGHERFEEQQAMKVHKPSFMDMVTNIDLHCQKKEWTKPYFNIEIKSMPEIYDTMIPQPAIFVQLLLDEIDLLNIKNRVNLQSFDLNILKEIRKQDGEISVAQLVDNTDGAKANLERLGYIPNYYSPHYALLNEEEIKFIHSQGIKIVPWTVNDKETMRRLIQIGVDGIITDYPNYIQAVPDTLAKLQ